MLEKQPDMVVPIASISKLMTALVVLDAKLDLQEVIAIGDDDVDGLKGTRSRLPVGTTMTREAAMLLALMSSENRAAHALGRHYPGGMHAFVLAMNKKAHSLGMYNSRFEEPTGLSSNNVLTAHDLARMVAAAARYPEIRNFSTTAEAKVELNGRIRDFHNTNALVRSDNWEIGVSKTGYFEAGRRLGDAGSGGRSPGSYCPARFAGQDDAGRRCKPDRSAGWKVPVWRWSVVGSDRLTSLPKAAACGLYFFGPV